MSKFCLVCACLRMLQLLLKVAFTISGHDVHVRQGVLTGLGVQQPIQLMITLTGLLIISWMPKVFDTSNQAVPFVSLRNTHSAVTCIHVALFETQNTILETSYMKASSLHSYLRLAVIDFND